MNAPLPTSLALSSCTLIQRNEFVSGGLASRHVVFSILFCSTLGYYPERAHLGHTDSAAYAMTFSLAFEVPSSYSRSTSHSAP